MTEASGHWRKVDEFHVILAFFAVDAENVQRIQETVFVRLKALQLDQNEDVSFDEGFAEVEEFLEKFEGFEIKRVKF